MTNKVSVQNSLIKVVVGPHGPQGLPGANASASAIWNANKLQGYSIASAGPSDGQSPTWSASASAYVPLSPGAATDHGTLSGLTGSANDDHTQYALLDGRSGGQTIIGGQASSDILALKPNFLSSAQFSIKNDGIYGSDTLTHNTRKNLSLWLKNYSSANLDLAAIYMYSTNTINELRVGGGKGSSIVFNTIGFYTASAYNATYSSFTPVFLLNKFGIGRFLNYPLGPSAYLPSANYQLINKLYVDGKASTAVWNANKIQGYSVASTAPTVGTVLEYSASASAYSPQQTVKKLVERFTDINEWQGFVDYTQASTSFVNATRTFTIQPVSGSFKYYSGGIPYTKSSAQSIQIANTNGAHYIYYNGSALAETSAFTLDLIKNYAFAQAIYWNTAASAEIYMGDEMRHGCKMDGDTHSSLHETDGFKLVDGGGLTDMTTDGTGNNAADAQFGVEATIARDEDARFTHSAKGSAANWNIYYKSGASASPVFNLHDSSAYCVLTAGTGRAAFNTLSAGVWVQQEVSNGYFTLEHIFTNNDKVRSFGIIQGESQHATLLAARDAIETEVSNILIDGVIGQEIKFVGSIIVQSQNTYSNAVKSRIRTLADGSDYLDLRDFLFPRGGTTGTTTDHGALVGLTGSANDDHTQYALLDGRTGGQTLTGGRSSADILKLKSFNGASASVSISDEGIVSAKSFISEDSIKIINQSGSEGFIGYRNLTNNSNQDAFFTCRHYNTSQFPVLGMRIVSQQTFSQVSIGGPNACCHSVTRIAFYTASTTSAVSGFERGYFSSAGNFFLASALKVSGESSFLKYPQGPSAYLPSAQYQLVNKKYADGIASTLVTRAGSSTTDAIPVFANASGNALKNSNVTISSAGLLTFQGTRLLLSKNNQELTNKFSYLTMQHRDIGLDDFCFLYAFSVSAASYSNTVHIGGGPSQFTGANNIYFMTSPSPSSSGASLQVSIGTDGTLWARRLLRASAGVTIKSFLNENDLSSNSSAALATQKSIKTYIDGKASTAVWNANKIQGYNVASAGPANGQILKYSASASAYTAQNETGGAGEANTASNDGAGAGVFNTKSGVDLRFKSLVSSGAVVVSGLASTITVFVNAGSAQFNANKIQSFTTPTSLTDGQYLKYIASTSAFVAATLNAAAAGLGSVDNVKQSPFYLSVKTITASAYTLASADYGYYLHFNSASAQTLSIPAGLTSGAQYLIKQKGAGQLTVNSATASVTLNTYSTFNKTAGQNAMCTLISVATNEYDFGGNTA